jgi:hypothetical protein
VYRTVDIEHIKHLPLIVEECLVGFALYNLFIVGYQIDQPPAQKFPQSVKVIGVIRLTANF